MYVDATEIPVTLFDIDFVNELLKLKLPQLISYPGKITSKDVNKVLQEKYKGEKVEITMKRIGNNLYYVEYNITLSENIVEYKEGPPLASVRDTHGPWEINDYIHIFNNYYYRIPKKEIKEIKEGSSVVPSLVIEKYVFLEKDQEQDGVYQLACSSLGYFYPDLSTIKAYNVWYQNPKPSLRIRFNPKTDVIKFDKRKEPKKEIKEIKEGSLVVPSLVKEEKKKDKEIKKEKLPNILDTITMSKCIDGYTEKFLIIDSVSKNPKQYFIAVNKFYTRETIQEFIDKSEEQFAVLKIMFHPEIDVLIPTKDNNNPYVLYLD